MAGVSAIPFTGPKPRYRPVSKRSTDEVPDDVDRGVAGFFIAIRIEAGRAVS